MGGFWFFLGLWSWGLLGLLVALEFGGLLGLLGALELVGLWAF